MSRGRGLLGRLHRAQMVARAWACGGWVVASLVACGPSGGTGRVPEPPRALRGVDAPVARQPTAGPAVPPRPDVASPLACRRAGAAFQTLLAAQLGLAYGLAPPTAETEGVRLAMASRCELDQWPAAFAACLTAAYGGAPQRYAEARLACDEMLPVAAQQALAQALRCAAMGQCDAPSGPPP